MKLVQDIEELPGELLKEKAWDFFLSTFKVKRPMANQILLLHVNNIHGKISPNSIEDIPIAYARTGPGVSVEEKVVPLVLHTVHKLEEIGIQVKAIGSDLAYACLMEKDKKAEPKTLIFLQYQTWDYVRTLGSAGAKISSNL